MDQDQVALGMLVRLPLQAEQHPDVPIVSFVEMAGLRAEFALGTITESTIASHLESDLSLIELWLRWSVNKRGRGPYFYEDDGWYIVGDYFEQEGARSYYDNPIFACADFVFRELTGWLAPHA